MIKYLGSKRRLVPVLSRLCLGWRAQTVLESLDRHHPRRGHLQARGCAGHGGRHRAGTPRCSCGLTWPRTPRSVDHAALTAAIEELNALPGEPGYFTETFCVRARFFQPENGACVDAVRAALSVTTRAHRCIRSCSTSLVEAADRVDSTAGVQMAYVKQWAPRSYSPLTLRAPEMLPGTGRALRGDAVELASTLPPCDLAYLDPPYNQHRYFTNYHVWETLVVGDEPADYGIAGRKRIDACDDTTKSVFNARRKMPDALRRGDR